MYILDTDLFSLYFVRQTPLPEFERRIVDADTRQNLFVSIVVSKEALKGAIALVNRYEATERVVSSYTLFRKVLAAVGELRILPFDDETYRRLQSIDPAIRRRIGTRDSHIAAAALRHGFTVVTRNVEDFKRVPGLRCVDWTRPAP